MDHDEPDDSTTLPARRAPRLFGPEHAAAAPLVPPPYVPPGADDRPITFQTPEPGMYEPEPDLAQLTSPAPRTAPPPPEGIASASAPSGQGPSNMPGTEAPTAREDVRGRHEVATGPVGQGHIDDLVMAAPPLGVRTPQPSPPLERPEDLEMSSAPVAAPAPPPEEPVPVEGEDYHVTAGARIDRANLPVPATPTVTTPPPQYTPASRGRAPVRMLAAVALLAALAGAGAIAWHLLNGDTAMQNATTTTTTTLAPTELMLDSGVLSRTDGTYRWPDGSEVSLTGVVTRADGTVENPAGGKVYADGSVQLSDGTYLRPTPPSPAPTTAPGSGSNTGGFDTNTPEFDTNTPEFDTNTPGFDTNTPGFDTNTPEFDTNTPEFDTNTP